MFASKSLFEHALRGVIGIGAILAAIAIGRETGVIALIASLALAAVALVAFRGCPVCWTIGMFETVRKRLIPRDTTA